MIRRRDPRQLPLIDPWGHLGPKRRQLLENSWAGLFRQEILSELPVKQLARYDTKKALGCFSQVKPSASEKTLATVAQEGVELLQRFTAHPRVSGLPSYRLLQRALNDHCEVKPAGVTVKPPGGFQPVFAESFGPGGRLWQRRQLPAGRGPGRRGGGGGPLPGLPPAPGLSLADFQVSPGGRVPACPQGEAPLACHYRKHRDRFAFASARCRACPQGPRGPVKAGKKYPYLRYAEKAGRVAARRSCQQTAQLRGRYRWRAGIEGTMSAYDRRTGVKRLRVRGLKAVRCCATLKAVGVNLFRAARVRRARRGSGDPATPRSAWLVAGVKKQMRGIRAAITNFLISDAYNSPIELQMAA